MNFLFFKYKKETHSTFNSSQIYLKILWLVEDMWKNKGHFRLWSKVKRPSVSTNGIARNQEFGLSTLHTRDQSPTAVILHGNTFWLAFWPNWWTLEGSLGRTRIETQTMIERSSILFIKKWKIHFISYFQPVSLDSQQKFGHLISRPLDLDVRSV